MMEFIETCFFRNVNENDRNAVDKSAGSDGAGLGILHRGMRRSGRDAHTGGLFWGLVLLLATAGKSGKQNQKKNREPINGQAQLGTANFQGLWNRWHHTLAARVPWTQPRVEYSIVNVHGRLNSDLTIRPGHAFRRCRRKMLAGRGAWSWQHLLESLEQDRPSNVTASVVSQPPR